MEIGSNMPQNDEQINQRVLSPSIIALDNSDNPNINETNSSLNLASNQVVEQNQAVSSSAVDVPTNSNSTQIQQDSDSESEHFFSNFNIKKRSLN